MPAGWGTPNRSGPCRRHGGCLPSIQAAAAKADAEVYAQAALTRMGLWGNREDNARPLQQLTEELSRTAGRIGALERELVRRETQAAHPQELDALARELQAERGHLLQVAEAARRAGLPEHEIEVQQQQGQMLAAAFQQVLALLALDTDQAAAVGPLVRWALLGADLTTRPPSVEEMRREHAQLTERFRERTAPREAEVQAALVRREEQLAAQRTEWADQDRDVMRLRRTTPQIPANNGRL
jgi:hypothetical protein